jgi:hypothetical protein
MSQNLITSQHSEDGKDVTFAAMVGTVISVQAFNQSSVSGTSSRRGMEVSTTHAVKTGMWINVDGKELELSPYVGGVSARVGHKVAVISVNGSRLIYRDAARINLTTNTASYGNPTKEVAGNAMLGRIGPEKAIASFVLGAILIVCVFWFLEEYFSKFLWANMGWAIVWSFVFFFIFPSFLLHRNDGKRNRAKIKYEEFLGSVRSKSRETQS